jgi:hypothetical protein
VTRLNKITSKQNQRMQPDNGGKKTLISIRWPARQVSIELTEGTVRRKTFSDAIQHPATILPAAVGLISGGYFLILSPVFGRSEVAIGLASICCLAAAANFSVRYPKLFQGNARELKEQFDIARALMEQDQLDTLQATIKEGFTTIGSHQGLDALDQLSHQYQQLKTSLSQERLTDSLSVAVIPGLAEETYRRGLGVLSDTMDLMNIVRTIDTETLKKEIAQVESELKLLENDRSQLDWLKLKEDVLSSLKEQLKSVNRLNLWVEQLLYQAQRCEATLHAARIELTQVRVGGTKSSLDSIIKVLEDRIKQVKEVQEEINRLGY